MRWRLGGSILTCQRKTERGGACRETPGATAMEGRVQEAAASVVWEEDDGSFF
jgi:hypothetical protein